MGIGLNLGIEFLHPFEPWVWGLTLALNSPTLSNHGYRVELRHWIPLTFWIMGIGLNLGIKFLYPFEPWVYHRQGFKKKGSRWQFQEDLLTLLLLVANFVNTKLYKNPEKWPKPWKLGTHLKALSESYLMSTNMTGFGWFSKILAFLCSALEGLSIHG